MKVICCSFNITNRRALAAELGFCDHDHPASEHDILLGAYAKWGERMGDHIYGGFALAISDGKKLFCVRDPFGLETFYYYETDAGQLLTGISIGDIMAQPGFRRELNAAVLPIYLRSSYSIGEETFFLGVKKLMPGCFLTYSNGEIRITRYFIPSFDPEDTPDMECWAGRLHARLQEVVAQMEEESPPAAGFLSGGVDSSYVAAMTHSSVLITMANGSPAFDESEYAKQTATYLGREHIVRELMPEQYFAAVPYVITALEQPLADPSCIGFALGCMEAAKYAGICYSGEGADEFFGGYNDYILPVKLEKVDKQDYFYGWIEPSFAEIASLLREPDMRLAAVPVAAPYYLANQHLDAATKLMAADIGLFLEGFIFLGVNRLSKAAGLRVRAPLADRRIFDLASRIPNVFKFDKDQNKIILRKAAERVLQKPVTQRRKRGFPIPVCDWLKEPRWAAMIETELDSSLAKQFFDERELRRLWEDTLHGTGASWIMIWRIYLFLSWYRIFFEQKPDHTVFMPWHTVCSARSMPIFTIHQE